MPYLHIQNDDLLLFPRYAFKVIFPFFSLLYYDYFLCLLFEEQTSHLGPWAIYWCLSVYLIVIFGPQSNIQFTQLAQCPQAIIDYWEQNPKNFLCSGSFAKIIILDSLDYCLAYDLACKERWCFQRNPSHVLRGYAKGFCDCSVPQGQYLSPVEDFSFRKVTDQTPPCISLNTVILGFRFVGDSDDNHYQWITVFWQLVSQTFK